MKRIKHHIKKREKTIGTLASIIAVLMFVALIEVLISNLKGTSNIFIQPVATAINGLLWSMYAFSKEDYYLLIPNLCALVLGIITTISAFV